MKFYLLMRMCFSVIVVALLSPAAVHGQTPDEADRADDSFEIERTSWLGEIGEDQILAVDNGFGNVICRYGGVGARVEVAATIQHFASEEPRLEVVSDTSEKGIRTTVGFRARPQDRLITEPAPGQLKRADLVVFVPEGRRLEISTRQGSIDCKGIHGDIEATTTSGSVLVRETVGRIEVSTRSGPVTVLFSPHGSKRVQRVETVSGRIEAHIPENADIELRITTRGEILSDYDVELADDVPDGMPKHGVATVASTGSELELTSETGPIIIVRRLATE